MAAYQVTFIPDGNRISVAEGTDLLSAATAAKVEVRSECGGAGVCGECKVIVREGEVETEAGDLLSTAEREAGYVLACRATVVGDVVIEIPPESRRAGAQVLMEEDDALPGPDDDDSKALAAAVAAPEAGGAYRPSALCTKVHVRLPLPTADDNISDLDRLERALRLAVPELPQVHVPLVQLQRLPRLLRDADWDVTVTLGQRGSAPEVILVEPGDTTDQSFAAVVDIGTTTVATSLVDLAARKIAGTQGMLNPQAAHGQDVITRIVHAERGDGLHQLHESVVACINAMIADLAAQRGITADDVQALVCAGNTTMIHLLLQVDPAFLRRDPYVPAVRAPHMLNAAEAGIRINPQGLLACLPGVSSYVGGDITAGVLASGMDRAEAPQLLIDLGTNGEIVLGNREWMVCTSASAGPAFEGGGMRCGVLAAEGAIQRVELEAGGETVRCKIIGDGAATGICGSGYLDLLAELLSSGVIDRQGVLREGAGGGRVRRGEDEMEYLLVAGDESGTGRDVVIVQSDIESLIRSKGAIFSAARVLVNSMGMEFDQLDKIYIGGGFGNYMNIGKAIRIGLLPDLPEERFSFIGNSSLSGARLALLSYGALRQTQEIANRMTNIELSNEPSYMDEFVGSLFLPHTNGALFPNVIAHLEEVPA